MTGADMEKTIVGKLARLDRLPNTLNGNPRFVGDIVTPAGDIVKFWTIANNQFSYVIGSYVGAFGRWRMTENRGKTRVAGVDFATPGDRVIFSHIGG